MRFKALSALLTVLLQLSQPGVSSVPELPAPIHSGAYIGMTDDGLRLVHFVLNENGAGSCSLCGVAFAGETGGHFEFTWRRKQGALQITDLRGFNRPDGGIVKVAVNRVTTGYRLEFSGTDFTFTANVYDSRVWKGLAKACKIDSLDSPP